MLKKVFFINHAPKEFHNLLVVFVVSGMLFTTICFFVGEKRVSKITTFEADEEFIEMMYPFVIDKGYTKTIDEYKELLKVDKEVLIDGSKIAKIAYRDDPRYFGVRNLIEGNFKSDLDLFKAKVGLPFEYSYKAPYWIGRFSAFASCWVVIALSLLFLNFTLKPIANRYKYFWFVPYILSIAIPSFLGFIFVTFILAG